MAIAQRRSGAEVASAFLVLALLVVASEAHYTLFSTTKGQGAGGTSAGYTRYDGPVIDQASRAAPGGSGWLGVIAVAVMLGAFASLSGWFIHQRIRRHRQPVSSTTHEASQPLNLAPFEELDTQCSASPVESAWQKVELLVLSGTGSLPASRTTATTARAAIALGAPEAAVGELALLYDRDRYSLHPLEPATRDRAQSLGDQLSVKGDV